MPDYLQKVGPVGLEPVSRGRGKRLRLGEAFLDRGLRDEIACVFGQIPLLAQLIEPDDGLRVDSQHCGKRLNCRLICPGLLVNVR